MKKPFLFLILFFLMLLPSLGWNKSDLQSEIWIENKGDFVFAKVKTKESFFIPQAHLQLDSTTVEGWPNRLTHHFAAEPGSSVILHFEGDRLQFRSDSLDPEFYFQLNVSVPQTLFKNQKKITGKNISGYISWVDPQFPDANLFAPFIGGYIQIWKIKNGQLYGHFNFKFNRADNKNPVHVYGRMRAVLKSLTLYDIENQKKKNILYQKAQALDDLNVPKDTLRPRYDYKKAKSKYDHDPWFEGRDSSAW